MSKCKYCAGTGKECGCGQGRCDHCDGTGELTDPPFGLELKQVLPEDVVSAFADYWCDHKRDATLGEFIQLVAQKALSIQQEADAKKIYVEGYKNGVYCFIGAEHELEEAAGQSWGIYKRDTAMATPTDSEEK